MIRILAVAAFALPMAAQAQETLSLAELLSNTHIHGIAEGPSGHESVTLATHHGIFTIDLSAQTVRLMGSSRDDFMGFSQVPGGPGKAFASGHPASGGNLGVIRTEDGGASWLPVSEGIGGPVDFHNMEVSRADAGLIYGIGHDGAVQRGTDSGATWAITGTAPEKLIDVATSARDPNRIFAATEGGLFVSADAGATWQSLLLTAAPVSTVDMGADGKLRAVQLGRGLIELDEATGAVTLVTAELPGGYLLYLAVTQAEPLRLMALSGDGTLVVSDDGGARWRAAVD